MPGRVLCSLFAALLLGTAFSAGATAADVPPRVIPFERYHATAKDQVAAGNLLLGELNCTSCHTADKSLAEHIQKKQAPVLDTVGNRVRPQYLLKFLMDPQTVKPGTSMPNALAGIPEAERKDVVEAIVHFLATTGTTNDVAPLRGGVNRGEQLYHSVGCLACHDPRPAENPPASLPTSIPLGTPSRKYTLPGLTEFVQNPLSIRPGGRMPHLNLNATDARDVASFLLNDLDIAAGLQYSYYPGNFDKLPDFSKLKPKETGEAEGFDLKALKKKGSYGLRFEGVIKVDTDVDYLFLLGSDDGSRLTIDDKVLIDNDGVHPFSQKRKPLKLKAGTHSVVVDFFEKGGDSDLQVMFEAKGKPPQDLASLIAIPEPKEGKPVPEAFVVNQDLAAKGREFFTTLGCASCHSMKVDGKQVAAKPTHVGASLADLKGVGGCLQGESTKSPRYALDTRQQIVLQAALAAAKKPAAELAGKELVDLNLIRFNCIACHTRGELGGVEETRNPHFKSDMPEMGDEGRIPPSLTGAGAKLNEAWIKTVMDQGAKDRPYMFTRMPRFGLKNVESLVSAIQTTDAELIKPVPAVDIPDSDKKFKAIGRQLVGGQGMSCIKCHTFANKQSTGIQALSLTTMTKRLRDDWFHNYLINPQAYRPGTRMPAGWPNGESQLPKILDGNTAKQIRSMWAFLSDGDKAALPSGLVTGAIELIAFDEAIMYRNFIEGAGSRAIGVGYPEKLNLAFDANNLRLAMIWHNGFMDASRHWTGRGVGYEPPLGDNVVKLPDGAPFAVLKSSADAWPTEKPKDIGYQFNGYRLGEKQRPTFLYSFNGIQVEDQPAPIGEAGVFTLERKLAFKVAEGSEVPADLQYRAMVADKIEAADGGFKVNGEWLLKIKSGQQGIVRQSNNKSELLIPIRFENRGANLTIEYDW
ncbi:Cytochrome c [Anatilimnocola aggregata]|uniref:Cytochrome c n=1 Tax=Anatilimnocola aggregata TaxID=2528021 RepID=A0A517YJB7_9BACT|nr:PA14 domain-containing protein [Anatilimnocola aggregata]QDU30317.1 Cytochrome c [Anatilimnocola aggregata]